MRTKKRMVPRNPPLVRRRRRKVRIRQRFLKRLMLKRNRRTRLIKIPKKKKKHRKRRKRKQKKQQMRK